MNRTISLKRILARFTVLACLMAVPLIAASQVGAGNDLRVTAEKPGNPSLGFVMLVSLQRG